MGSSKDVGCLGTAKFRIMLIDMINRGILGVSFTKQNQICPGILNLSRYSVHFDLNGKFSMVQILITESGLKNMGSSSSFSKARKGLTP